MLEEDLTKGEKLYLLRIRERKLQREFAIRFGVHRHTYRKWEGGNDKTAPNIKIGGMNPWEHYTILRIRHRMLRSELARRIGTDSKYVWSAEVNHGPMALIVEFWGD